MIRKIDLRPVENVTATVARSKLRVQENVAFNRYVQSYHIMEGKLKVNWLIKRISHEMSGKQQTNSAHKCHNIYI